MNMEKKNQPRSKVYGTNVRLVEKLKLNKDKRHVLWVDNYFTTLITVVNTLI